MVPAPPARHRGGAQAGGALGGAVGALLMPPLALWLGWRVAVALSAGLIGLLAGLTWLFYRDPPRSEVEAPAPREGSMRAVLRNRDLWLVSTTTLVFAGMQTVWMAFLVLYLQETVRVPLVTAAGYLVMAQVTG
ncbi:MAG: MFS transporter, partial [Candidatus Rokubacteria bacterium]|nr:MFS transporter [Candidatus Rokubacteria bacterium]